MLNPAPAPPEISSAPVKMPSRSAPVNAQVEESVRSERLRAAWHECTSSLENSTPEEIKDCQTSVASLRSEFLNALKDVPDDADRDVLSTVFYINLKSQWILLNIWSGYKIASGRPDEILMCRLGMVSALLDRVEKAISPDDVSIINDFLAHPVSRPTPLGDVLNPLPPIELLSLPSLSHHNSRKLREMREAIAAQEAAMVEKRKNDALLAQTFGTADGDEIVAKFRDAQNQLAVLQDLQALMGGVEASMNFVNS